MSFVSCWRRLLTNLCFQSVALNLNPLLELRDQGKTAKQTVSTVEPCGLAGLSLPMADAAVRFVRCRESFESFVIQEFYWLVCAARSKDTCGCHRKPCPHSTRVSLQPAHKPGSRNEAQPAPKTGKHEDVRHTPLMRSCSVVCCWCKPPCSLKAEMLQPPTISSPNLQVRHRLWIVHWLGEHPGLFSRLRSGASKRGLGVV